MLVDDNNDDDDDDDDDDDELDTIRVRIWRVLMERCSSDAYDGGKRMISLKDLSKALNEKISDVKHHLQHVEKQSKTLANKSTEWKERRGIPNEKRNVKLKKRFMTPSVGSKKRKEIHIKLE
jgi:DNA-binding MarR family transcriptional regulator